jgi:hypothetical protein
VSNAAIVSRQRCAAMPDTDRSDRWRTVRSYESPPSTSFAPWRGRGCENPARRENGMTTTSKTNKPLILAC